MNQLYLYETYCDTNFIRLRKQLYAQNINEAKAFSQDKLDLMNIKRSLVGVGKIQILNFILIFFI
jgi:hypothetical protein